MTEFSEDEQREFDRRLQLFKINGTPVPQNIREMFLEGRRQRAAEPRIDLLDRTTLRALDDESRDRLLVKYVEEKIGHDDDCVERLVRLPRGLQVCFLSMLAESEVLNGGFHQFFFNLADDFAGLIAPALRELGDDEAARLFESAWKIADDFGADDEQDDEDANEADARESDPQALLKAFAEGARNSPFRSLDDPFAERAAGFSVLRADLVKAREDSFLG